MSRESNKGFRK